MLKVPKPSDPASQSLMIWQTSLVFLTFMPSWSAFTDQYLHNGTNSARYEPLVISTYALRWVPMPWCIERKSLQTVACWLGSHWIGTRELHCMLWHAVRTTTSSFVLEKWRRWWWTSGGTSSHLPQLPHHHPGTGTREAEPRSQYFQFYINYKLAILKCSKVKVLVWKWQF